MKDKIQFIIYNKQSHFKQSNIGLNLEVGGVTNIMGSKVFVYFDGDHGEFSKQIKQGIAQVMVNQQVYGASWAQVLKNSSLLTLPNWYQQGLTSYIAENWNPEIESSVRDGIKSERYKKFNRLSDKDAVIAGHSIWAYIVDTYGEAVIPNILYMSRVTQSIDKGFLYVLGISLKSLTNEWYEYYAKEYENMMSTAEDEYLEKQIFKIKKRRDYLQFKMSPDGNNFAYVTNQLGQYKIYIYYKDSDKRYKIFKKEFKIDRINDYSYPVLEWHPASEILSFVIEDKGLLSIYFFDINTGGIQVKNLFNMEKVTSMDYSDSGKEMVFSGVYKGQSDLYLYYVGPNSHKKLTDDQFDDLEPRFIENSTKIVFTSNRTSDSLGYQPTDAELMANQKDVWIIDYQAEEPYLTQVTKTPDVSESQPFGIDSMLYFLGGEDNISTRLSAKKDSFITHIDTTIHYSFFYDVKPSLQSYNRSIREHNIINSGQYTEVIKDDYKYYLMLRSLSEKSLSNKTLQISSIDTTQKTNSFTNNTNVQSATVLKAVTVKKEEEDENLIDISNYMFEKDKQEIQRNVVMVGEEGNKKDSLIEEFKLPNQRNYNYSFFNDKSGIKFSNNFVNGEYQQFTGGPYISAGLGAIIKFGTIDLFEDHKIFGGVRMSGNTREYFMTYQNLVSRTDKEYTASRTTYNTLEGNLALGFSTNSLKYSLKFPLNEVTSIRTTAVFRNDNVVFKSTEDLTLAEPNFNEFRAIGKIAFVFDNSRPIMTNIYYGTKFKLFAEYYQEVGDGSFVSTEQQVKDGEVVGMGNGENGNMQVVGLDFRHSLKISREIVWVNRLASSASFGYEKLIYYLGSLDEWIPLGGQEQFINGDDIDFTQNYRFHALAANLRGFPQNIRRGTNFAVINSELRFPVFKYFIRRPIKSKFVRNFQVVGFTDVGSAWSGLDPWGRQNSIDEQVIEDGPIKVTAYRDINPIVAGYGFGVRSTFLGYFLRLDWAWGVEDGYSKEKPQFYLSLSLDI